MSATSACDVTPPPPAARLVRLGTFELQNTLGVLAGTVGGTASAALEADTRLSGFSSNADQKASAAFVDTLNRIAEPIAAQLVAQAGTFPATCTSSVTAAASCARTTLTTLASTAWRRPATTAELDDLMGLYTLGRDVETTATAAERLTQGVQWAAQAIVQSPNFVYRTELGAAHDGVLALDPYEVASMLSYAVLAKPPDATLLAAAAADSLKTGDDRLRQVERLKAADPTAWRQRQRRFALEWAEIDTNAKAWAKQATLYPTFTGALKDAIAAEATAMVDDWLDSGSPLTGWFDGATGFVNQVNAPLYGLTSSSTALVKTQVPNQHRHGVLTLPAFLGTKADPDSSSPVLRGSAVLRRFLCVTLPSVPANVPPLPPVVQTQAQTTRQRFSMHTSAPACAGCHALIDPTGDVLENFDSIGAFRTQEHGLTVDSSGALVSTPASNQPLTGPEGLSAALLASPDAERCVATQALRSLHGRLEASAVDACTLERGAKALHDSGSVWSVVEQLVKDDHFASRQFTKGTP